ncbi:MAG TPA: ATP-binding protein [Chloroflexota bacterium]|jgi:ATPase family associated with various cellular activities (AAA)|nr:ATP-binding protein [Chloroflexota bacterium]
MAIIPADASLPSGVPPAPGGAPHGLRLTWSAELADRLQAGLPLTVLGQVPLDSPLGRLLIVGRSEPSGMEGGAPGSGGTFALAAVIMPQGTAGALALAPFGLGPLAGTLAPPDELRQHFPTRRTAEAIFVLDGEGRDRFVIGPGVVLNQLVVSSGTWPLLVPLFGPRTRGRPLTQRGALEHDLDGFCAVVAETVNAIYRRDGLPLTDVALTIRPTNLNADTALDGLRRLGRSAADLMARLPRDPFSDTPRALPRATVREGSGEASSFDEVGGQEEAKRELQAICLAIREPEAYRRWGARPPKGVLMYGPPGTGKTLLARCLAAESGANFVHVRATDVASKWYGEAERRLQSVFDQARRQAPAVLFFDEIDALARHREESHEATHRVVSTLLENMDGLEESKGIVVIAATNRPEVVDGALTRPGRFDRLVEVPLPDRAGRRAIFRVHLGKAERQAGRGLFEPIDQDGWEQLLDVSEGFSGAEIEETVRRVLEAKVRARALEGQITLRELLDQGATVARPW